MSYQPRAATLRYWVGIIALIAFGVFLVGLLLFNFSSGLAVLAGVAVTLALVGLVGFLARRVRRRWLLLGGVVTLLGLVSVVCLSVFFLSSRNTAQYPNELCPIASYRVVAMPDSSKLQGFQIQEYVTLVEGVEYKPSETWTPVLVDSQPGYSLPARQAAVSQRGFLLKEALIDYAVTCSESASVEIQELPLNVFYAAVYARDLQHFPYVDTETITWEPGSRNIRFSYIVPPFQVARPILSPLMGASSLSQWVLGLIAVLGTLVFVPIIQPIIVEIIQKYVKKKLHVDDAPG